MLGAEKEIINTYVETGQVKLVFWPITDYGARSVNAATAAHCAGEQNSDAFWAYHDRLFENFGQTYSGDRTYFVETAVGIGLDQAQFEACYDGDDVRATVNRLNNERQTLGIFNRPTFDINGQMIVGAQPFSVFAQAITAALP